MSFNQKNVHITKAGFTKKCLFVFIDAYYEMKANINYDNSWKENKITKTLISYIKENEMAKKWKLDIVREFYLDEYQEENADPDETPRIDMRFSKWQGSSLFEYFIEAKNLCETDWIKEKGTKVSSSYQLNRYIDTGVKHFFTDYYPKSGCLCGYIVQGNTGNIIDKLNIILKKKTLNKLYPSTPINNFKLIFTINQDNFELSNIFFEFKKR